MLCELFPIIRFLMGEGVRKTLSLIKEVVPEVQVYEVPSGTKVFDWIIPPEWEITDAYIEDECGNKIIDYRKNNLHVLAYSNPIDQWMPLEELKNYIYTDELSPDTIPYVTSYYKDRIGMCMSYHQLSNLSEGNYHIYIDSKKKDGSLTYGEIVLKGESHEEIIFHSVICHPSLANDELSGPALAAFLAREIKKMDFRRYTYRFIFVPETIGAVTYLSRNLENERQYNSPGIDIPVCLVCRSKAGEFPEYHTSNDNLEFVSPEGFQGSFDVFMNIIRLLEANRIYKTKVLCEPQLGKRKLYSDLSFRGRKASYKIIVDFLTYANGYNDVISISNILDISWEQLTNVINILLEKDLIEAV